MNAIAPFSRFLPLLAAFLLLLLPGCQKPESGEPEGETVADERLPEWEKLRKNARMVQAEYARAQLDRLMAGEFPALEAEAAAPQLPVDPASIGLVDPDFFYESFDLGNWERSPDWDRLFVALDRWQAAYPDSPHSRLARASATLSRAWSHWNADPEDPQAEANQRTFLAGLEATLALLREASERGGQGIAVFWTYHLEIARGSGWTLAQVGEMVSRGLEKFPEDPHLYAATCVYLLPRWRGESGQWQAWIQVQDQAPRWEGQGMPPALYAQVIWRLWLRVGDSDGPFFENPAVNKRKVFVGLDQLLLEYPDSVYWKTVRAHLAWAAKEDGILTAALADLDGVYDSWVIGPERMQKILSEREGR